MSETSQPSSENDGRNYKPRGSHRRQVHNAVERRRKDKINGWISKIGELLPRTELNRSKISILEETVNYIKLLVAERNKLLLENCSEVQAEEIKKLKRQIKIISEQNALYEKLLEKTNVGLKALPKKAFKYTDKFVRKNGVLAVKNVESDVSTYVDSAIQVDNNMCVNIPAPVTVNCSIPSTCENSKVSSTTSKTCECSKVSSIPSKNCKAATKSASSVLKSAKVVSAVSTKSVVQSCVSINPLQSNSIVNSVQVTQAVHQPSNISQENVIPIINWNDPSRNSASAHVGGVTTVLSHFPVMSTTLGSSFSNVYNKNVPTFIIPTGGNILQHFPSEKPSNTISILCPSTLPILFPQQVLSVPSIARNIGLPPTIICPGPVNNNSSQAEKSALGNTLLTINPNSVVPISSSLSANAQIILPSQSGLLGNACGNVNMTHNIISPLLTAVSQSEDLIVPLVQKQPVSSSSKSVQDSTNAIDSSCEKCLTKNTEAKTAEKSLETNRDVHVVTSLSVHTDSKATKNSENNLPKKRTIEDSRQLFLNSPLSLQLLSANKIISLASQSQNYKKKCSKKEANAKTICESLQVNRNKSDVTSDSFCVQTDVSSVQETHQTKRTKSVENAKKNSTLPSDPESSENSDPTTVKSNFSLTVLMGDSLSDKAPSLSNKNSRIHENCSSPMHDNISDLQVESSTPAKVSYINSSAENVPFSNISDSQMVSSVIKENELESSVQILSDVCDSKTNQDVEKAVTSNSKTLVSGNENSNIVNQPANNLLTAVSTSEQGINNASNFNSSVVSDAVINTSPCNGDTHIISKENSESLNFSSKDNVQVEKTVNIIQNQQGEPNMCSEITNSVNNTFNENVPYTVNETSINQSLLPSLFSSNQIVNLNSSVLMCQTGQENASGIHLPPGIQVSNESTNQHLNHCLLHNSHTDYQTFSVLNKDLVLSNSVTAITATNDQSKKLADTASSFSADSNANNNLVNKCNKIEAENSKIVATLESDCEKQFISTKKKNKSSYKEPKMNASDKSLSSSETSTEVCNNTIINKIHTVETMGSFNKSDASVGTRQEPNFIFTSDILARATESIFGNDILESPHMSKRNENCFSDEASILNVPVTTTEKILDINYKIPYSGVREDNSSLEASSTEKNKKCNPGGDLLNSDIGNSSQTVQTDIRNVQDVSSKQIKLCKTKKSKSISDSEPPCKKLKEMSPSAEKSSGHTFSVAHQGDKINEKNISTIHSNLSFLEKQVSSPSQTTIDDQTGVNSMGNFANQIHLPESSCKTPSSVDAMFSLTPMLGDILKDVSHNVNLDSRSANFVAGSENQSAFSSEKNFISFNYSNNSNEDYLNLPRMYFPIIPEISSAPVVHVTSVSFAHSVSLCSTQSDSQKVTETHSSDSQNKSGSKKKEILPLFHSNHNVLNLDLSAASGIVKQSECIMKTDSESQFNATPVKATNTSVQFENHHSDTQSLNSIHSANLSISQSSSQYNARDNFITPVSHSISFYPTISSSSNIQNFPGTTTSLSHSTFQNGLSNVGTTSISFPAIGSTNNTFNSQPSLSKPDNLSHSLCSLLKENSNIVENRGGTSVVSSQSTTSSSNVTQSKYSALSLISDQTSYSESVSTTTCHQQFVQSSTVYTTSGSEGQYISTVSSCSRNPKTSLSYSAESLLQTSCANTDKNKNNKNNRFQLRTSEKKTDRNAITNIHGISDTNIFMPVTSCDINIQNAPLVPLPPVTSFHNFSSAYTVCDTAPPTTIFNSGTRNQDIPLSLSNDNFLNHMNLNVESQMLSNRHEVSSTVPKPHSNITLPFENHNSLYNSCNFLPHVKPALENSRSSEASACFQPSSYSNNYSQQSQKPNCCHFSHRAVASNSDISPDINLSVSGVVSSFHEKNNIQPNRSGLQTSFSQSNSNFMGNFFYNTPVSCHDGNERNDLNVKPSTIRTSQEVFVPDGVRQSIHDQNSGIIFNSRKTVPSNRTKSKKPKNITANESVVIPTCIANYSSSQDNSCNKVNISYVPNGYFKSSSHPVLPTPSQIQCSQNKMTEAMPSSVIPANPSFNPVLHQQSDNFLNLNFQHPNFTMSPLPRPPTQPLSCSCLTTPIISHTFSSSTPHPVPNFNLSNILPDMGCSGNQVSFSPAKFPVNHSLSSSSTQCQTNSTITNSAHIVSHQSCTPSLYPPHPPMVRGTLNPILGHNSQSLIESQVSLVGTAGSVMTQNTTFAATQNPTFRNVIHPITFPRNDR